MKIFTHTQGRTGTAWLAELFRANTDWECHHERLLPENYGIHTPDIREMRMANSYGGQSVTDFWERKASLLPENYVETAHMLSKAGIWCHRELFGEMQIIHLHRPCEEVVGSMVKRGDYVSHGNSWLWYLDPVYHLNIVDCKPFVDYGSVGMCAWYWAEMEARKPQEAITVSVKDLNDAQFAKRFLHKCGVDVEDVKIPEVRNASGKYDLSAELEQMIIDASAIANNVIGNTVYAA